MNRPGESTEVTAAPRHDREILRLAVPAFLALVAEPLFLLADAAIVGHLGTPELAALGIAGAVVQTVVGSAKLLRETGEHPTVLRERVTSPGGTTSAAVRELEDHKVRAAFMTALEAARDRSRALAAGTQD